MTENEMTLRERWEEIVYINNDVPAIQYADAELKRLRANAERAGDVEGMAKVWCPLDETCQDCLQRARALSAWLKEG